LNSTDIALKEFGDFSPGRQALPFLHRRHYIAKARQIRESIETVAVCRVGEGRPEAILLKE
jgi:hypothetical protein